MNYIDIIPTHNSLRNLESFISFVADPRLIINSEIPPLILNIEGCMYLNDGHHRLTAALYLDIPLPDIKIQYATYSYAEMMEPNFNTGWLTPYDPRIYVRSNDCLKFKNIVKSFTKYSCENEAKLFMKRATKMFLEPRTANSLKELIPNGHNHCK